MPESNVELSEIEDWEKAAIIQVLRRNHDLQRTENRRLRQLQVRMQIETLTDDDWIRCEQSMRKKTGQWHRDHQRKCKNDNKHVNTTQKLYKQLNYELISANVNRKTENGSPTTSQTSTESKSNTYSSSSSKRASIEAWLQDSDKYREKVDSQLNES